MASSTRSTTVALSTIPTKRMRTMMASVTFARKTTMLTKCRIISTIARTIQESSRQTSEHIRRLCLILKANLKSILIGLSTTRVLRSCKRPTPIQALQSATIHLVASTLRERFSLTRRLMMTMWASFSAIRITISSTRSCGRKIFKLTGKLRHLEHQLVSLFLA